MDTPAFSDTPTDAATSCMLLHPYLEAFERGELLPHSSTLEFIFAEPLRFSHRDAEQIAGHLRREKLEAEPVEDKAYEGYTAGVQCSSDGVISILNGVSLRTYGVFSMDGSIADFGFERLKSLTRTFLSKLQNIANASKGSLFPVSRPETKRTGVRVVHIIKAQQPHVRAFDKGNIFNTDWLAGFTSDDDKLQSFSMQLVPNAENISKDASGHSDVNLRFRSIAGAELEFTTDNGYQIKTSVRGVVELEVKKGYLGDKSYIYERLDDTLDFADRVYLPWFRKEDCK